MLTIARLFGKSPFAPLQTHMNKVSSCVEKLAVVFENLPKKDYQIIEKLVSELSNLEHEADLTKNDIRNHLPKSLFLPIDRAQFLEILAVQDSIADKAEDIGLLLTLHPLEFVENMYENLKLFFKKNVEVFREAREVIDEFDELLESSFGGLEAEKVRVMVEQIAYKEHETDRMQQALKKQLFLLKTTLPHPSFYLWLRLIEEVGSLSHISERLANRIRMVLELK